MGGAADGPAGAPGCASTSSGCCIDAAPAPLPPACTGGMMQCTNNIASSCRASATHMRFKATACALSVQLHCAFWNTLLSLSRPNFNLQVEQVVQLKAQLMLQAVPLPAAAAALTHHQPPHPLPAPNRCVAPASAALPHTPHTAPTPLSR